MKPTPEIVRRESNVNDIPAWNDVEGRTIEQVLALFEKAAVSR